jgi:hypothetical protein
MIRSHVVNLVVFAILVSAVYATLQRDDLKSRFRFGLVTFGAFILSSLVIGWLMYPFPS